MTGLPSCTHCQNGPGIVQFPGVPGLYCPLCALQVKQQLFEPGADVVWSELKPVAPADDPGQTWPELVAAKLKD